jgi:hypothetical protein
MLLHAAKLLIASTGDGAREVSNSLGLGAATASLKVMVHRYWIEFAPEDAVPLGLGWGCGVTAVDWDDAVRLVTELLGTTPPDAIRVTKDVDVSTLDAGHVLPNMHPPNERGVWFPMLRPLS